MPRETYGSGWSRSDRAQAEATPLSGDRRGEWCERGAAGGCRAKARANTGRREGSGTGGQVAGT